MAGRTNTISLPDEAAAEAPLTEAVSRPMPGDLNEQLLDTDFWTDQMVAGAGIPIFDVRS